MTCRHAANDPNCSSHRDYVDPYQAPEPPKTPKTPKTPDAANYSIEDVERIGTHLIMKVKYPNCRNCAYEGVKVMVFLNVTEAQVLKWKKIDPHFRGPSRTLLLTEAPSPAARFPATTEGWADARSYANSKPKD